MEPNKNISAENRIIKEFGFDKVQKALIHPFFKTKTKFGSSIDVYLITIGHLWIYELIEEHGYIHEWLPKM